MTQALARIVLSGLCGLAAPALAAPSDTVALTHIRIIDGQGGAPVENGTVLIRDGRIVAAGTDVAIPGGAEVHDRAGDSVLPGLISDHSHVGQVGGTGTGPVNYTREAITAELAQYRRYGVTTVTALGNNRPLFDTLRAEAHAGTLPADLYGVDQGIGVPNGAPPQKMTMSAADQLFRPTTPDEARAAVDRMADEHTDLVKIWVDDFAGTLKVKMQPAIIRAVVAESHRRGLRVAAHIHDLDDAEAVVADGVDILAHGVRDRPVPADFVATLKRRGIWYIPTLELDESTTAWAEHAPWTRTAFARAGLSAPLAGEIDNPAWDRANSTGRKADEARASLAMNLRNIKTLHDAGVRIGFGTDSGATPLRVPGVAEHRELALLVQAGLSPMQAIGIATAQAAALLELSDRGVIAPGRRADLLVVHGDPSRDIANVDRIVETWENGARERGPG
ncbi:imidazolonepropionase-like amidohydrolase [Endobacter medicaginis]|uniref:Amidohydrolase family protein n=1 Tax=Endobacter medicaginis TaxID=1181271 RepID=A0A839V3C5_9PROT|nr:amidohydrolase family protein [Endobacter medicaginis]MBB3173991.1 imidazolonepropionase-like amidohydrolase [Endobacter medicaginis]MCX5475151.1 amidohydrolase family protein [Endobacter medicaginis]NVN31323.1 amidohydrolase family protein [Endobacter medicaginis]